jgi:hypothetical protein
LQIIFKLIFSFYLSKSKKPQNYYFYPAKVGAYLMSSDNKVITEIDDIGVKTSFTSALFVKLKL